MNISQTTPAALMKMIHHADTDNRNIVNKGVNVKNAQDDPKLKKACSDFEALILKQLIAQMRKSVPKSGLFDDSYAHNMYQSLKDEQLAGEMAESGGIGLADIMYKQLTGQIKSSPGK